MVAFNRSIARFRSSKPLPRTCYRLSDLAIRTGLSTATVHRLLTTLENRRFVQFDRDQSKWHVGARAFTVGATFVRRRNFTAQAIPYLRKLRDLTRECRR
jgi:IclR family acetate operon transcriptional repressor